MKNFIKKHKNEIFRYWLRKRMWTPYEMELKDPEQTEYEMLECDYGYLVEAIDLGYDWLIGISGELDKSYISYYKLSELELALCQNDQNDEE